MTDSLVSWPALMTLSGAAMITFLIVLYTSRLLPKWWTCGTGIYAACWGFVVLVLSQIANGSNYRDWRLYVLAFFNSFLVAAAAGKLSDKSIAEQGRRDEGNQ